MNKRAIPGEWKRHKGRRAIPPEFESCILTLIGVWMHQAEENVRYYKGKIGGDLGTLHVGNLNYWTHIYSWLGGLVANGLKTVSECDYQAVILYAKAEAQGTIQGLTKEG